MKSTNYKKIWLWFTQKFGASIIHPQFIILRHHYNSLNEAKRYAKGKLIDIGCGNMYARDALKAQISDYTGVDYPMTKQMYPTSRKPEILAEASSIPVSKESFDTALMLTVVEHLFKPQEAFNESFRILKKGGNLILTVPFMYPIHDRPHDYYRYTTYALGKMLKESGFKVLVLRAQGTFIEFWLLSLICFCLKNIKYNLVKPFNLFRLLYTLVLFLFCIPLSLVSNLLIILTHSKLESNSDFPIYITAIAKKT